MQTGNNPLAIVFFFAFMALTLASPTGPRRTKTSDNSLPPAVRLPRGRMVGRWPATF
jgi:hypothetical protein